MLSSVARKRQDSARQAKCRTKPPFRPEAFTPRVRLVLTIRACLFPFRDPPPTPPETRSFLPTRILSPSGSLADRVGMRTARRPRCFGSIASTGARNAPEAFSPSRSVLVATPPPSRISSGRPVRKSLAFDVGQRIRPGSFARACLGQVRGTGILRLRLAPLGTRMSRSPHGTTRRTACLRFRRFLGSARRRRNALGRDEGHNRIPRPRNVVV